MAVAELAGDGGAATGAGSPERAAFAATGGGYGCTRRRCGRLGPRERRRGPRFDASQTAATMPTGRPGPRRPRPESRRRTQVSTTHAREWRRGGDVLGSECIQALWFRCESLHRGLAPRKAQPAEHRQKVLVEKISGLLIAKVVPGRNDRFARKCATVAIKCHSQGRLLSAYWLDARLSARRSREALASENGQSLAIGADRDVRSIQRAGQGDLPGRIDLSQPLVDERHLVGPGRERRAGPPGTSNC